MGRLGIGKSGNLLVSQTDDGGGGRRAVSLVDTLQVDDAAVGETITLNDMTHDDIIAMGIDAQVARHCQAVVHHIIEDAMSRRRARQAMHHMIGSVIEPIALKYLLVGGLGTWYEGKRGDNFATVLFYTQIAMAIINVLLDGLLAGITVNPLIHIATRAHNGARLVNETHDHGYIAHGCQPKDSFWIHLPDSFGQI